MSMKANLMDLAMLEDDDPNYLMNDIVEKQ
jgi:hypothetical protein